MMRCRDIDLHVLMADDEDSVEVRSMAGHVETCVQCQRRLLEVAGDHELLTEVRETLQAIDETLPYSSDPASSSIILCIEGSSTDDFGAECEPVALDFLSPPGHPEMLGRIGRYEVERVIGSGGMGVVLKGFDSELHRVVAIKVLKPHLAHNGAARRRFAREAQSAAAVVHEHVIPIHDVLTDSGTPYLVMQYVPGQSLQARVDERGPLEAKEVLRIARQVAAGLAAAHAQGVVHRDVKPANILLEDSVDRVLISDFGLARTVDDATLTRTGVVAGTPHYMSPEQAKGDLVDHRSDLFSLGSCIYFMCTGRPPFRAEHALAILNRICNDQHRPVEEINADVPPELADLIDRLLSKDRTERFRDAVQAEHQIETVLSDIQQGRRSKRLRWTRRWPRWRKRFRRGVIISMVLTAWMWTSAGFWPVEQQPKGDQPGDLLARNEIAAESPSDATNRPASRMSILRLPPDTFEADLHETKLLLEEIESKQPPAVESDYGHAVETLKWDEEIHQLKSIVNELIPGAG